MSKYILLIVASLWANIALAQTLTPAEAAEIAKEQTGGKVIRVSEYDFENQGYSVRMLTASGQVKTLFIPDTQ